MPHDFGLIRLATCDDAQAITQVHISSWQTTYWGIGIDEYIDNQSVDRRVEYWRNTLCNSQSQTFVYVAVVDGQVVGFAAGGPERSNDPEYKGELYALYLLKAYQRQGLGQKLVGAVMDHLLHSGIASMLIWVLAVNSARFFYERCGGQVVRWKDLNWGGKTFEELGYGWLDLRLPQ
ncbi:MAG: GNAT family N-acetyltransferase [Chloroflexota bacterium]